MKKLISLLCALCILFTFVACANVSDDGGEETTTPAAVADTDAPTETPDSGATEGSGDTVEPQRPSAFESAEKQDLEKYVFTIRYADFDDCYSDFHSEGLNGNVLNDAVYERNMLVEEALNMSIDISWDAYTAVNESVKTQVNAGDHSYDLFASQRTCLALSYGGYLYNMKDIPSLRLDKEWWDQGYINTMTVNDKLFTVVGDISVASLLFVSSLTFNKRLIESYGLQVPYDTVRENKWTFDAMKTLLANTSQDLNNDGQLTPGDDIYSLIGWGSESGYSLFYSTGYKFMNRNASGDMVLEYDAERFISIIEKVRELWDPMSTYFNNGSGREQHAATWKIFADGQAVCADIVLSKIGTYFMDMPDDYGIVPLPKFDEAQEDYVTYSGFTVPMLMIPANEQNTERTGIIMEALGSASYDNVTPKLLEIVTKVKNVRDEDSSEMINVIIRTKIVDTAHFFDLPGYGSISRTLIASPATNPASSIKAYKNTAEKQWNRIQAEFDKLG